MQWGRSRPGGKPVLRNLSHEVNARLLTGAPSSAYDSDEDADFSSHRTDPKAFKVGRLAVTEAGRGLTL